jgi:hypothetical protein
MKKSTGVTTLSTRRREKPSKTGRPLVRRTSGIKAVTDEAITHAAQISDAQKEIKVLKDATLNNMVNNVFLKNFDTVNSVAITSGIYDPVARKIYV